MEGFFQKYGFATKATVTDGIGIGLDEVEMLMLLTDTERQRIAELVSA